jgi:hypothetical protein
MVPARRSVIAASGALTLALGLAGAALAASSASDPKGDVQPACYGECSEYSVDLKSISVSRSNGFLKVKVSQYGKFKPAQPLYWPQLELYTKSKVPSRGPEPPFSSSNPADYSLYVQLANGGSGGKCPRPSKTYEMDLWKGSKALGPINCSWPSQSTIIYSVPLKKLGNPGRVHVRAWQAGLDSSFHTYPLDVVPDKGSVSG